MEGLSVAPAGDQGSVAREMVQSSLFVMRPHEDSSWSPTSSAKLTISYNAWNEKFLILNVFIWLHWEFVAAC